MNIIKKISFNYFFMLEDGFKVRKKDGDILPIILFFVISAALSFFYTRNIVIHKDIDTFSAILIFVGIIIGFLITTIVLYTSLDNSYLKKLKQEVFLTKKNKPINLKKYQITKFDFILINLFYIFGIGLLLSLLIAILLIADYLKLYDTAIIIKNINIFYIIKLIFSVLFIFLLFYFIILIFRITSIIYKIVILMNSNINNTTD